VAKWLIDMGVHMGARFRPADEHNPDGYWEDLDFRDVNQALLEGRIPTEWYKILFAHHLSVRMVFFCGDRPWGFKDPRMCHTLWQVKEYMPKARHIRLHRDAVDVVKSCVRCYGWPQDKAVGLIAYREKMLDTHLPRDAARTLDIAFRDIVSGGAKEVIRKWL
jgi:hypothetical protein